MPQHLRWSLAPLLLLGALLLTGPGLAAQTLRMDCGAGLVDSAAACRGEIAVGADSLQRRMLQVRVLRDHAPARGAIVRFRATSGTVHPDTAVTGADGVAEALWHRSGGTQPVGIAVDARIVDGNRNVLASALKYLEISRPPPPAPRTVALNPWRGGYQSWFENSTLRNAVVFAVEERRPDGKGGTADVPIDDDSVCNAQRVAFRAVSGSGTVTPDTTVAQVYPIAESNARGCFVEARWALGAGSGEREMRATLVPGKGYVSAGNPPALYASARAMPRLVAGLAYSWNHSYRGLEAGSEVTFTVERTLPDGSVVKYDSTDTPASAYKEFDGDWELNPLVGLTMPVPLNGARLRGWSERISLTAGADLANIGDHWFAGVSLTRLGIGLPSESLPIDFHLLGHWRRTSVLTNPVECRDALEACKTDEAVRFQGASFMLSADATTVISEIIKKLAPSP